MQAVAFFTTSKPVHEIHRCTHLWQTARPLRPKRPLWCWRHVLFFTSSATENMSCCMRLGCCMLRYNTEISATEARTRVMLCLICYSCLFGNLMVAVWMHVVLCMNVGCVGRTPRMVPTWAAQTWWVARPTHQCCSMNGHM